MAYTTIDKPSDYFNTVLYTGNETTGHSITGVGFQPDLVWIKNRTNAKEHHWFDSVRGATKFIESSTTDAEETATDTLSSFDSDGFTLGNSAKVNANTMPTVSWNWLASNTTASNTDGDITSTVSANTTSGFSIVSYTGNGTDGATVGHGLGIKPKIVFYKRRDTTSAWTCLQDIEGSLKYGYLNTTAAFLSAGETPPTSSLLYLSGGTDTNASGGTHIAYCFAEKKGFSKFGSYTGNGSTDGTFVYTGFKPAWVMIKRTNATNNWHINDNKRDTFNVVDTVLYANTTNAEATDTTSDFLSNGFKLRTTVNFANGSGDSYIYMAFAENPFVTSTGIPTTAR